MFHVLNNILSKWYVGTKNDKLGDFVFYIGLCMVKVDFSVSKNVPNDILIHNDYEQ